MKIKDQGRVERLENLVLVLAEAIRFDLGHQVAYTNLRKIREAMDQIEEESRRVMSKDE